MAEDTTGWSEKGKHAKKDGDVASGSTPSRPSKRQTSDAKGAAESSVVRTPSSDAARKVAKAAATAGQRDRSFASRLGFPVLVGAICIVGLLVVGFARSQREALARPVENLDHWHAVYGVYSCNAPGEGDQKYLPAFQSTQSDTGIHSHGDGLMHIHPFVSAASGDSAQLRHWITEMNIEITPERILVNNIYDPREELIAGEECADGTGTAEIKLLHWDFDFQAQADDRPDPEVITEDFGLVNFEHDREVYVFAYVSEDTDLADIPIPSAERFNTLNNVSAQLDYNPTQLNPVDSGVDGGDDTDTDTDTDTDSDADAEAEAE